MPAILIIFLVFTADGDNMLLQSFPYKNLEDCQNAIPKITAALSRAEIEVSEMGCVEIEDAVSPKPKAVRI